MTRTLLPISSAVSDRGRCVVARAGSTSWYPSLLRFLQQDEGDAPQTAAKNA
jgi:hypothetical protein